MQSELQKALGEPADFEWPAGRMLKVGPIAFEVEAGFSAVLQRKAAAGLARNRAYLGEAAYLDALRQLNDDLAAGEFDWTGRVGEYARATVGGTRELAYLCLKANQPDFPREEFDRLYRDAPARTRLVAILQDLVTPPPNGSGPPPQEAAGPLSEPRTSSASSSKSAVSAPSESVS